MSYQPYARGPHPAGVTTIKVPSLDGRTLDTEVWYPAFAEHKGADLDPARQDGFVLLPGLPPAKQSALRDVPGAPGRFPFIVFSHGHGSHRRQSTFLCTHLASHGYVVAAPDHAGNTIMDFAKLLAGGGAGIDMKAYFENVLKFRPSDVMAVRGHLADRPGLCPARIDHDQLGLLGHSLGGWTTLAATPDAAPQAICAMCPAGGENPRHGTMLRDALRFDWQRVVPALVLACDRDALLPLVTIRDLVSRLPSATRFFILENADHFHVCDAPALTHDWFRSLGKNSFLSASEPMAPFSELCPADRAHDWTRSAVLTHFDAFLSNLPEARAQLQTIVTPDSPRAA